MKIAFQNIKRAILFGFAGIVISFSSHAQVEPEDCPAVTDQYDEWLNPTNGWIYDQSMIATDPEACRTNPEYGPLGWAKSQCTSWARFRSGWSPDRGDGGEWANNLPQCETNNFSADCWSYVPAVGTLFVQEKIDSDGDGTVDGTGHVAVVECVEGTENPTWIKISEYNYNPCQFGYRKVDLAGTAYKYVYPGGKPVALPTNCELEPVVKSAIVTANDASATSVTVVVKMTGTTCQGVVHRLYRKVYDANGALLPSFNETFLNVNVLNPLTDNISGLPSCSKIEYKLEKRILVSLEDPVVSEPKIGYNLTPPTNVDIAKTGNSYTFSWSEACSDAPNTLTNLTCTCGVPGKDITLANPKDSPHVAYNLPPSTQYTCSLWSYNNGDVSIPVYKSFVTEGTGVAVPAPPVISEAANCHEKLLTWFPLTGHTYQLFAYRNGQLLQNYPMAVSGNTFRFASTVDGEYGFSLQATNSSNVASAISTPSLVTINCRKEVPELLTISTGNCAGVTLSFGFAPGITISPISKFHILRRHQTQSTYDTIARPYATPAPPYTFTDFSAENNEVYYYKVAAEYYQVSGQHQSMISTPSNAKSITANSPPQPPQALTTKSMGGTVTIQFKDVADDETGFMIERKSPNKTNQFEVIKILPASPLTQRVVSFTDTDPILQAPGYAHMYRVFSISGTCASSVSTTPTSQATILGTPTNFQIATISGSVRLSWNAVWKADEYEVFRKLPTDTDWPTLPFETTESYSLSMPSSAAAYQYKVRARSESASSVYLSAFAGPVFELLSVCPTTPPLSPTILAATTNDGSALIEWQDNSSDEHGFIVETNVYDRSTSWELFQEFSNATPLRKTLDMEDYLGHNVGVRVRAFRNNNDAERTRCYSNPPNPVEVLLLKTPSSIKVNEYSPTAVTVTWVDNNVDHDGYELEVRTSGSSTWIPLIEAGGYLSKSYRHEAVDEDEDYHYRVRAVNKDGQGSLKAVSGWLETDSGIQLGIPEAPEDFTVSVTQRPTPYTAKVRFAWDDRSTNENSHEVTIWKQDPYTQTYPDHIFDTERISSNDWTKMATGSQSYNYPVNTTLGVGRYKFGMAAKNAVGISDTIYTYCTVYGPPMQPTLSTPSSSCSGGISSIELTWSDRSTGPQTETTFRIYRKIAGESDFTLIHSTGPNVTSYTDEDAAVSGKSVYYYVASYSAHVDWEAESTQVFVNAEGCVSIQSSPVVVVRNSPPPTIPLFARYNGGISPQQSSMMRLAAPDVYTFTWYRNGSLFKTVENIPSVSVPVEDANYEVVVTKGNQLIGSDTERLTIKWIDENDFPFEWPFPFPRSCDGCWWWWFDIIWPQDPNDIIGPVGYGPEKWISAKDPVNYTVRFENDPEFATASAQKVMIKYPIPANVDPYSFRLGTFGFANQIFTVPDDRIFYTARLNTADSLGVHVEVTAGLDVTRREAFWVFQAIDPITGRIPVDATKGFLPVNDSVTHQGEGFATFTVNALNSVQTGDTLYAKADIVFDINEAISTPRIFNTLDAMPPISAIDSLPSVADSVTISVTSSDGLGSGVATFDLFISTNGGPYQVLAAALPAESTYTFVGEENTTYCLYSIARDHAGNQEPVKASPDVCFTTPRHAFVEMFEPADSLEYCTGNLVPIRWASINIDFLNLYYFKDDDTTLHPVALEIPGSDTLYQWAVPSYLSSGSYRFFLVSSADSSLSATSPIFTIHQPSDATIASSSGEAFCSGITTDLTVNPAYTVYAWSTGDSTRTTTVASSGLYSVVVTDVHGCTSSDSLEITVYPLPPTPNVTAADTTSFCEGGEVQLDAPAGYAEYLWSNGSTTPSITVMHSGIFDVIVTDSLGCTSARSSGIEVSVHPLPSTPFITAGDSLAFCEGGTVELFASPGYAEYAWSNGASTPSIIVSASGIFTVIVTDSLGCSSPVSDSVSVLVYPLPPKPIITASGPLAFCDGGEVALIAPVEYAGYIWSNGSTDESINVNTSGLYEVVVIDSHACTSPASDPVRVTVYTLPPKPDITITGRSAFCYGDTIQLAAPGGFESYLWSNGATSSAIVVNVSGTFSVQVTDTNQCSSPWSDSVTVSELPQLLINAGKNRTVYYGYPDAACTTLTAEAGGGSGGYSFVWSTGETGSQIQVCPDKSTTYTVMVVDAQGCAATDDVRVCVINVSCGKDKDDNKVQLCHHSGSGKHNMLCVGRSAVATHLAHGDRLGSCALQTSCDDSPVSSGARTPIVEAEDAREPCLLRAFPNPFSASVTLEFYVTETSHVEISAYDIWGHSIETLFKDTVSPGKPYQVAFKPDKHVSSGLMLARMITSTGEVYWQKLMYQP